MKRWISILISVLLFLCIVLGYGLNQEKQLAKADKKQMAAMIDSNKFFSAKAIELNTDEQEMLLFGSSELTALYDTIYHPSKLFADTDFTLMLIGQGYFQSLSHAITLSALGDEYKGKKVALIVSPQWFTESGITAEAFSSKFSQASYIRMLRNDKISFETKSYMAERVEQLLSSADPQMQSKLNIYNEVYLNNSLNPFFHLYNLTNSGFIDYKTTYNAVKAMEVHSVGTRDELQNYKNVNIDWKAMYAQAESDGAAATHNDFYIKDDYYETYIKGELEDYKNYASNQGYSGPPEYEDLRSFLNVCNELGIEPLLISVPVHGYWYDYIGFSKANREEYYQNIRDIAQEYEVELADFSGYEYEKYFLNDIMHLGWKVWVMVNESIYNFAQEK